ncbi:flavin-dependent monooxygenase QhpG [Kitasatospora sp. McL0602]|uniref:flavin-dependent monooxygenase QhpG n=1 Tax=Kitasatospora sp. McL0602 TaxID=3439530 RepID=UPI003F8A4A94
MTGEPSAPVETEVCVIGAGPAGAVCAKRLAELGHQVLVVERHRFPRPHIGEALTPAVWPLLDALGLRPAVLGVLGEGGFRAATETWLRWSDDQARIVRLSPGAPGLTVDRARFDHLLLDAVRTAGAQVLQPATAGCPRRTTSGWSVPLRTAGAVDRVDCRFLVDASGRSLALGSGSRRPTGPRTLALHATWRGSSVSSSAAGGPVAGPATRVSAGPEGWCWGTVLPDGSFRAMAFTDPQTLRRYGTGQAALAACYQHLLRDSDLLAGLTAPMLVSRVAACDATGYADPDPVTEYSIRIGEAAFALDPLSSSGVDKAMQSAMAAAVTVHTLLTPEQDRSAPLALAYYRENQRRSVDQHTAWAAAHYDEQRTHRACPFWQLRARPGAELPADAAPLAPLPAQVRLSPAARLVDTPCVVDDRIELRRALAHPALPRPVAYVAGVELAPLLTPIQHPPFPDLADLLRAWSDRLPPGQATAVVRWLHRHGILQPG